LLDWLAEWLAEWLLMLVMVVDDSVAERAAV